MEMDDDSDDSLSSSPPETLDQFREKWQKELNTTKRNKQNQPIQSTTSCEEPKNTNNQVMYPNYTKKKPLLVNEDKSHM